MAKSKSKKNAFDDAGFDLEVVRIYAKEHGSDPVSSFNKSITLEKFRPEDVDCIIVGTLTPFKGRERGMFYASDANYMYEFIDDRLPELKKRLENEETREEARDEIIELLKNKRIAFLDVVAMAAYETMEDYESAADRDIGILCLDKDSFEPFLGRGIKFIANSRDAEAGFRRIVASLAQNDSCIYCPQTLRGKKPKNCNMQKTKENLKQKWRALLFGE